MVQSSWFSTERNDGVNKTDVHHHNTACKEGKDIEKNHHRYGTDNRPLCKQCARLDAAGR